MAEHVDRFVQELAPAASRIGAEYGIDPALIITQAAIESGWGKNVAGNNYFGVKSHGQPGGQNILTHEEINGQLVPVYDNFRQYNSLEESMRDYAQFLKDNPRYSEVFKAPDLQGQIDAIASSGYATSSKYPGLLNDVSHMVTGAWPDNVALGYAGPAKLPTIGPTGGPALNAINAATGKPAPKPSLLQAAWQGITGGFGNLGQLGAAPIMRSAQAVGQNMTPAIMRAALGTVKGRTALIDPVIKQVFTGSPTGMQNTRAVQAYRDQGASPSQAYEAANRASVERAIANSANSDAAQRLNERLGNL